MTTPADKTASAGYPAGSLLRTAVFTVIYHLFTAVLGTVMAPYLFCLSRPALTRWTQRWSRAVLWLLHTVCGIRHRVVGQENVPPGPVIYALKHQSSWETIVSPLLFPDAATIIRQELLGMPVLGWYLRRLGLIPIDQAAGVTALLRILADSSAAVKQGRSIVIYPEGERVPVGQRRPYQRGAAVLYKRLGLPVVPVAVNAGVCWPLGLTAKRPGTITLEFLPALSPGLTAQEFLRTLEDRIETATTRLVRSELGQSASDPP